jgi:hypothetical protein
MTFQSINRIQTTVVKRITTSLNEIDWLYGVTKSTWGIPEGAISLWAGQGGLGSWQISIRLQGGEVGVGSVSWWGDETYFQPPV